MPLRGRFREELDGPGGIASLAGVARDEYQRQPVLALGGAGIGGALDQPQSLCFVAAVEQDGAQPGLGVGGGRTEGPQGPLGGGDVTLSIGDHGGTQRRGDIRRVGRLLGLRDGARGHQGSGERRSRGDHLVLNV